jgi:hypothetical protein
MSDERLTKLTVNLTPAAMAALNHAADATTEHRTDTVHRALRVYAAIVDAAQAERRERLEIDNLLGDGRRYSITVQKSDDELYWATSGP